MSEVVGIGPLVEALAKAKKEIETPKKTRKGEVRGTSKGGKDYSYTYWYADRSDVIEAYRKPLADNGLQIIHALGHGPEGKAALISRLVHTSGAEVKSEVTIPTFADAQALGAWLTYLERYASCALLDIAAEEDHDGAGAKRDKESKKGTAATPQAKKPEYECVTAEQVDIIRSAAKAAGVKNADQFKAVLLAASGVELAAHVPADKYEHVLEQIGLVGAPA